jgi:hypothetical protein
MVPRDSMHVDGMNNYMAGKSRGMKIIGRMLRYASDLEFVEQAFSKGMRMGQNIRARILSKSCDGKNIGRSS